MITDIATGERLFTREKNSNVPIYITIFILVAYILFFCFFDVIPIKGISMEKTIHNNQYCLMQRNFFTPERGDIVVINTSDTKTEHCIIKRIVGVGGDKIIFMFAKDNTVDLYLCKSGSTKFVKQNEKYINERMIFSYDTFINNKILPYRTNLSSLDTVVDAEEFKAIEDFIIDIPKNKIYFLGDNRNHSKDARYYGPIDKKKVMSKFLLTF